MLEDEWDPLSRKPSILSLSRLYDKWRLSVLIAKLQVSLRRYQESRAQRRKMRREKLPQDGKTNPFE